MKYFPQIDTIFRENICRRFNLETRTFLNEYYCISVDDFLDSYKKKNFGIQLAIQPDIVSGDCCTTIEARVFIRVYNMTSLTQYIYIYI